MTKAIIFLAVLFLANMAVAETKPRQIDFDLWNA